MTHRIRIANLSYTTDGPSLEGLFAPYGIVRSAEVLSDRILSNRILSNRILSNRNLSNRNLSDQIPSDGRTTSSGIGLGLVEMGSDEESEAAIRGLDGSSYCGRVLEVRWAVARARAGAGSPATTGPDGVAAAGGAARSRGPGGADFEADESIGEAAARRRRSAGSGGTTGPV